MADKPRFSVVIQSDAYKNLINNTLGDPNVARQFVADISTVVSQNYQLQNCDAKSIVSAGLLAQTLKLPLAPSLGFAYVVPYGDKAQFQIGWKGLVQLAQRTGQFERLGVRPVHEGEYQGQDEFGDDLFKFSHDFDNKPIVGYYAYFKLLNGFTKTMYWTVAQCKAHGKRYSKTGKLWADMENGGFEAMAQKTVLKLLLNRYAPLSVELQKAVQADQAVIKENGEYEYVDNEDAPANVEPKKKTTVKLDAIDTKADENGEVTPSSFFGEPDQPF